MDMINIGQRLELFCDDYMLDKNRTTAEQRLHTPIRHETVLCNDRLWEGNISNYYNLFFDDEYGKYRMYYKSGQAYADSPTIKIHPSSQFCYAESLDGINWTKPVLNLWGATNILTRDLNIDNFYVFKDQNPTCPDNERYKAVCGFGNLWYYASPDGLHFDLDNGKVIMRRGAGCFDSLNTVRWSERLGRYVCFFRASAYTDGSYPKPDDKWENLKECVRGIMYTESDDFFNWDEPVPLNYSDGMVFEMYTNCVSEYYRAKHIYTAFPTRYVQRGKWDENFDSLGGRTARLKRYNTSEAGRGGLAVTEALFMASRDGVNWKRYSEAFIRPGPQNEENWIYGGGYPAVGMAETQSTLVGADNELSIYIPDGRSSPRPNELIRYTLRVDGFVSMHSGIDMKTVVTKPFIYNGEDMYINFSTSAYGYVQLKLRDTHCNELISPELFGDSINRRAVFYGGSAGELSGKPVTLEIHMSDADIYSFRFQNNN